MRVYKDKEIAVLNAAWDLFTEKGFHDTKISEIARVAGIGKGTVYEYFSSKEDLAQEMIVYYLSESHTSLTKELAHIEKPVNQLVHMARRDIAKGIDLFKTMKILQMIDNFDKQCIKASVMEIMSERMQLINGIIQEGMACGDFKQGNVYLTTLMYIGMINNAMMMQHTSRELTIDTDELIEFIIEKMK